jgi:cell division protein FtsB
MEPVTNTNIVELEKQLCSLMKENKDLKKRVKELEVNLSYVIEQPTLGVKT